LGIPYSLERGAVKDSRPTHLQEGPIVTNKNEAEVQKNNGIAGAVKRTSTFLKETREELRKVTWPDRKQLISESTAVILMVILSATVIYFVDSFFKWVSGRVFG
jgi:preprotein translocase subunit SecE